MPTQPLTGMALTVRTELGARLDQLSRREWEVLALMAEGRSNLGIARRLWLSDKTVETHIRRILLRLDIPAGPEDHRRVLAARAFLLG